MKKNLFLLFCFYFFVLQSVFIGLIWGESKFYWLALINFIFICLIAIFSRDSNSSVDEQPKGKYEDVMKKEPEFKMGHFWIFLISFLFGVLVAFLLKEMALYLRVGVGIIGSMIVFLVGGLIFNYKSFRSWEGKLYLILLILTLFWAVISLLNIDFSVFQFKSTKEFNEVTGDTVEETIVIPEEDIIFTGNDDEYFGTGVDGEIFENSGTLVDNLGEDVNVDVLVTFADVIKYLLKDEKLSTNTDLKFSFIGKSNPDYPYYMTAYEKKMIGKDLQPTKNVMCETYVVMKGLAEGWNVGKYSDIKQAYWNYAKNNGLLPDCQYGKYVTLSVINN